MIIIAQSLSRGTSALLYTQVKLIQANFCGSRMQISQKLWPKSYRIRQATIEWSQSLELLVCTCCFVGLWPVIFQKCFNFCSLVSSWNYVFLGQYFEISFAIFIACESSLNTEEQEKDTWKQDSEYSLRECSGKTLPAHVFFPLFFSVA